MQAAFEGAIIGLYKPVGVTSFAVVQQVRHITGIRKVGHAGTLDPFADGVLIVGIGSSATKLLGQYQAEEKEYEARVVLGIVTDTYDNTGKVIEDNPFSRPDECTIAAVLRDFEGDIEQIPPMYSAVKQNGVRLYKSARRGIEVEREPRRIFIRKIELLKLRPDGFDIRIICSKGTYIRTLAYDIGRKLGPGAYLSKLTRTRVGRFQIGEVKTVEEFGNWISNGKGVINGSN